MPVNSLPSAAGPRLALRWLDDVSIASPDQFGTLHLANNCLLLRLTIAVARPIGSL